jgi:hypothetical protein
MLRARDAVGLVVAPRRAGHRGVVGRHPRRSEGPEGATAGPVVKSEPLHALADDRREAFSREQLTASPRPRRADAGPAPPSRIAELRLDTTWEHRGVRDVDPIEDP